MEAEKTQISEEDTDSDVVIHNKIVTYEASWKTYGIGCSWKNKTKIKIGLGSFKETQGNEVTFNRLILLNIILVRKKLRKLIVSLTFIHLQK